MLTTCPFDLALDPGGTRGPRFLDPSHSEGSWFSGQTATKLSPRSVRKGGGTGECVLNYRGHFLIVTQLDSFIDGMRILVPGALRVTRESAVSKCFVCTLFLCPLRWLGEAEEKATWNP